MNIIKAIFTKLFSVVLRVHLGRRKRKVDFHYREVHSNLGFGKPDANHTATKGEVESHTINGTNGDLDD